MEIEKEIYNSYIFQGQMNAAANSIEIIIEKILEKNGIAFKKLLSSKISQLKELISDENLIYELIKFNNTWNITKHGKMAVGLEEYIMFRKDKGTYVFTKQRQEELLNQFSSIMGKLIECQNTKSVLKESFKS